jgi:hypothetical protein
LPEGPVIPVRDHQWKLLEVSRKSGSERHQYRGMRTATNLSVGQWPVIRSHKNVGNDRSDSPEQTKSIGAHNDAIPSAISTSQLAPPLIVVIAG